MNVKIELIRSYRNAYWQIVTEYRITILPREDIKVYLSHYSNDGFDMPTIEGPVTDNYFKLVKFIVKDLFTNKTSILKSAMFDLREGEPVKLEVEA